MPNRLPTGATINRRVEALADEVRCMRHRGAILDAEVFDEISALASWRRADAGPWERKLLTSARTLARAQHYPLLALAHIARAWHIRCLVQTGRMSAEHYWTQATR